MLFFLIIYVWNEANNSHFKKTILHYAIDGQWKQAIKNSYPYEYNVEIPKSARKFEYWFESVTPHGVIVKSETGTLYK